mmetsp:Transcript_8189/g.22492  ORF Transcript_8189/g.22492 Transcript_8189/m.22492 type:complete len:361 (-) Transcript_8189:312-1394(-)
MRHAHRGRSLGPQPVRAAVLRWIALAVASSVAAWSLHGQRSGLALTGSQRHLQIAPARSAAREQRAALTAHAAIPLRLVGDTQGLGTSGCGAWLAEEHAAAEEAAKASGSCVPVDLAGLEVALAQDTDLPAIADLLIEGFEYVIKPKLLNEETWGVVAAIWNACVRNLEKFVVRLAMSETLYRKMKDPSVQRPRGRQLDGHGMGLVLVERGSTDRLPVAFCELCLLKNDGSRPDDSAQLMPMLLGRDLSSDEQPYMLNLCVARAWRRRGVGKAFLRLVENIVRDTWKDDCLYLHADRDEAAFGLYSSAGYTETGRGTPIKRGPEQPEAVHMRKIFSSPAVASVDGAGAESSTGSEEQLRS